MRQKHQNWLRNSKITLEKRSSECLSFFAAAVGVEIFSELHHLKRRGEFIERLGRRLSYINT